jgi:hypothetical protein
VSSFFDFSLVLSLKQEARPMVLPLFLSALKKLPIHNTTVPGVRQPVAKPQEMTKPRPLSTSSGAVFRITVLDLYAGQVCQPLKCAD